MLTFPIQCNFPPLSMRMTSWIVQKKLAHDKEIVRKKVEPQATFFCSPHAFSYKSLIFDQSN